MASNWRLTRRGERLVTLFWWLVGLGVLGFFLYKMDSGWGNLPNYRECVAQVTQDCY